MEKKNLILVATDFTEIADNAIEHAIMIAKKLGSEIRLIHVLEKNFSEQNAMAALERACDNITSSSGVAAKYVLRKGHLIESFRQVIMETKARMLVMGSHGIVGLKQKLFGAQNMKVVAVSQVPVVIVKDRKPPLDGYKKIVFPVTAEKIIREKIDNTVTMAKAFEAEVHLYSSFETSQALEDKISLNISDVQFMLEKEGIKSVHVEEDSVSIGFGKHLVKYADRIGADLVAIKDNSNNRVEGAIYRYQEENIVNNKAGIPVMCVHESI